MSIAMDRSGGKGNEYNSDQLICDAEDGTRRRQTVKHTMIDYHLSTGVDEDDENDFRNVFLQDSLRVNVGIVVSRISVSILCPRIEDAFTENLLVLINGNKLSKTLWNYLVRCK